MTIGYKDLNKIKLTDPYYNFIYILLQENCINSSTGISVVPRTVQDNVLIPASVFIADNVPPIVMNSTLNMGLNQLVFDMSEPVRLSSIEVGAIRIQNSSTGVVGVGGGGGRGYREITGGVVTINLSGWFAYNL